MALTSVFKDTFDGANGSQPDTSKWVQSIANGFLLDGNGCATQRIDGAILSTNGKFNFTAGENEILLEVRGGDDGSAYDLSFYLYDTDGDSIRIGNTSYRSWGKYLITTGKYTIPQANFGSGSGSVMWYRISIKEKNLNYYVSSDRITWSLVGSRTLNTSIKGQTFYITINGAYYPYHGAFYSDVELFEDTPDKPSFFPFFNQYL